VAGRGLAVVISTAGFTVTESAWLALTAPVLSVTCTLKLYGVAVATDGAVPVNTPAAESESQAGRPVGLHVNPGVPPVSANVWLYAIPEVVAGSVVVVTLGAGLMVI